MVISFEIWEHHFPDQVMDYAKDKDQYRHRGQNVMIKQWKMILKESIYNSKFDFARKPYQLVVKDYLH